MNIILGFGKTEQDFEKQEQEFVDGFLRDRMKNVEYGIFTDEVVCDLKNALKKRTDEYKRLDKVYHDAPEYPDRYSYYYFNVLADACDLVVIFRFSHINRKHALSPDGWALLQGTKLEHYNYDNYQKKPSPSPEKEIISK